MIKNFKWLLFASISVGLVACSDDDTDGQPVEVPISAGTADFSKYVALGDSFAAGFSDNALFKKGQENSYPSILAQQLGLAGGGDFTVPYMNDNVGGFSMGGNQIPQFPTRLYFNGVGPVNVTGVSTTVLSDQLMGPFNNMGIPGAKSFHLTIPGYGAANPYFGRFDSSAGASVIADAVAQNATFFSLWIGGNDVLSYASSGGIGVNQTGNLNPATYGSNDITDPMVFDNVYNGLVNAMTATGAKGVVANLPYINTLPYFTTVPYNPVPLDEATATQLNTQLLGPIKQILTALGQGDRIATLSAGATNPLLIRDEALTNYGPQITGALVAAGVPPAQAGLMGSLYGQARHAKKNGAFVDYILLPTRTIIGTPQAGIPAPFNTVGVTYPLQDGAVLTDAEAQDVETATDAYNNTIKNAADAKGLAFVDTKAIMQQLLNGGIRFGNYHLTATYVTGGTFSLDGIHPSARGYAYLANQFLKAIGVAYGSSIPEVNIGNYNVQYGQTIN